MPTEMMIAKVEVYIDRKEDKDLKDVMELIRVMERAGATLRALTDDEKELFDEIADYLSGPERQRLLASSKRSAPGILLKVAQNICKSSSSLKIFWDSSRRFTKTFPREDLRTVEESRFLKKILDAGQDY